MSLPAFLSRAADAAGPLLGGVDQSEFGERLDRTSVVLRIDDATADMTGQRPGYLLAANLVARLYPRIGFDAPDALAEEAATLGRSINPGCVIGPPKDGTDVFELDWTGAGGSARRVRLTASAYDVFIDGADNPGPCATPAAMVAAALAVGELFRAVFAEMLGEHGREEAEPWSFNLITLGPTGGGPAVCDDVVELGRFHLAGCGAVGQAVVATLREMPVTGTLVAVDDEQLDLGNLQRYVLSAAADVDTHKTELVHRALADHDLRVEKVKTLWGADQRSSPGQDCVLAALDSSQGRIELQAGLPRELHNGWTQPQDLGVSRHEAFGVAPCLACLYWPTQPRPSETELIAGALGEHELRVVLYRQHDHPIGQPLPPEAIVGTGRLSLPDNHPTWAERSLLSDLIGRYELDAAEWQTYGNVQVQELYRVRVCAGILLEERDPARHRDVSVPLAHQSALAGILLAVSLLSARDPNLRAARPEATQTRYDVVTGGLQVLARPRQREKNCLCGDPVFAARYATIWPSETAPKAADDVRDAT